MIAAGPKRILLTGDTIGGVWTFLLELARDLSAKGKDVCVATLGRKATTDQQAEMNSAGVQWFDSDFKVEWMEEPWEDVGNSSLWISAIVRDFKPDLIHWNTFGHAGLAWNVPTVLTVHSCVLSWWAAVRNEPLPMTWLRYTREVERALNGASLVTAPSAAMMATIAKHYGFQDAPARVIYNGRHAKGLHAGSKKLSYILTAGRLWDEGKNIEALRTAAAELAWPVMLAGEPDPAADNWPNCRLLGRLSSDEMAMAYAEATIYAAPAKYEPFGLAILEAAMSGCALVLGDIPSLRELWDECAIFVQPDDSIALASALQQLIDFPIVRGQLVKASLKRAAKYSQEATTAGYMDAYREASQRFFMRRTACAS